MKEYVCNVYKHNKIIGVLSMTYNDDENGVAEFLDYCNNKIQSFEDCDEICVGDIRRIT